MKVICIDEIFSGMDRVAVSPREGVVYEVAEEKIYCGVPFYSFVGVPEYWQADAFIPISEICETQFERNYNKELV